MNIITLNNMGYRATKIIEENASFVSLSSIMGFWDICAADAICRELGGGCFVLETGDLLDYKKHNLKDSVPQDFWLGNDSDKIRMLINDHKEELQIL